MEKLDWIDLKKPYNILNAVSIEKELSAKGITACHKGISKSYDGKYESNIVVDNTAFGIVCDMLYKKREEANSIIRETQTLKKRIKRLNAVIVILSALLVLTHIFF